MAEQVYDWKRFWCPRSSQINLGDRGYLTDPESEYGKYANPELVGLEAITDVPCLVLLGEPGIGKSQELEKLRSYTETLIDKDDQILLLDLEDCSEDKLYTNLFKSKVFIDWINGTHRLYLFLDSLEQGWLKNSSPAFFFAL
jgi:predicted NACHT family NTPase